MKLSVIFLFSIFSIQCLAWECEVNGKLNDKIKPEDHYEIASDVVFGTIINGHFFDNFEIGSSYLMTFNGNTKLEFCDYFFPLHIENRDMNIDRLRILSENSNFIPSMGLRRLLRFFDEGT